MISQNDFIERAKGRKGRQQRFYVKVLRKLHKITPLNVKKYHNAKERNIGNFVYLTICRRSDFDMVMASIYTLLKNSEMQPKKIVVVSDGSWNLSVGKEFFSRYGLDVETVMWDICSTYYSKTCPALAKWAERQIWGKKMASILYFSEKEKVLFSDPDVLWYNTPLTLEELDKCKLKLSIDNSHNYDDEFVKAFGYERLYETKEPINCGAVFIQGGLSLLSKDALRCIEYEGEHCGSFAEQTVFAIMDLDYDNRWTMHQITSEIGDMLFPFTAKTIFYEGMIARHYLWRLKWIYWKDFTKQRLRGMTKTRC